MEGCSSSLDRISNLPSHISQIILVSLPLRDMARTAILSKGWRYQWLKVPQLVFKDDPKYLISLEEKYRYTAMKVIEILLLHHGPISKFSLDMKAWTNCSVIDSIIPFLSRNGINELTLLMPDKRDPYKMPSSILSCVELRHLSLSSCVFQPLTIVGFSKLVSLELLDIELCIDVSISSCPLLECLKLYILNTVYSFSIDAPNLMILYFRGSISSIYMMNTPLLKVLSIIGSFGYNNSSSVLNILFLSLPHLENLYLAHQKTFFEGLAVGNAPDMLPKLLINLRMLEFKDVYLCEMDELTSTLWILRSFPNLRKFKFHFWESNASLVEAAELYLKMQDHSKYSSLKLEVEITLATSSLGMRFALEFSKFLLDVSPVLGTIYIKPNLRLMDANGYKMLLDLACYPRASPKSKIVYVGLESLNLTLTVKRQRSTNRSFPKLWSTR